MIDLAFLFWIVIFALLTVKGTPECDLNRLLAGKFAIFISLYGLTLWAGFSGGWWEDLYRASLDLIFVYVFLKAGGKYLAVLCGMMFAFHVFNIFAEINEASYTRIMIGFQVLQLMFASWGASDGLINLGSTAYSWYCDRFRSHIRH